MRAERLLLAVCCALACALFANALWRGPFFPSNDGPHHVFGAYARAHIDDPHKNFAAYLVPNGPTTSNGFADLFTVLEGPLGWRDAERGTLAVICAIYLLGCVLLARALHPARAWLGFVAGSAALGWPLFLGFYEFVLASGLSFLIVVFALRMQGGAQRVGLAALLAFLAAVHFLVAALAACLILLLRVVRAPDAVQRRREILWCSLTAVPALALALRATGATDNHGDVTEVLPFSLRLMTLGSCTVGGSPWRQGLFAAAALMGLALLARRFRTAGGTERAFGVVALAGIALPLVAPWTFFGWQHAAVRVLPLCATLAIVLVPLEALRGRLYPLAAALCVLCFAGSTLWARGLLSRVGEDLADVDAALRAPLRAGYTLSAVTLDPPWVRDAGLFRWDPLRGIGSLFGVVDGGLPAYAHTVSPQAHTVLVRDDLRPNLPEPPLRSQHQSALRGITDDDARQARMAPLMDAARAFENVVAFERPQDHALWRRAGFRVAFERGRVLLLEVPMDAPERPAR